MSIQCNIIVFGRLLLDLRIEMLHHLRDGRAQRPWYCHARIIHVLTRRQDRDNVASMISSRVCYPNDPYDSFVAAATAAESNCLNYSVSLHLEGKSLASEPQCYTIYEMVGHSVHNTGMHESDVFWPEEKAKTTHQERYQHFQYVVQRKKIIGLWPIRPKQKVPIY